jgi:uncharacterized protein (UPF0335 family)
MVRSRSSRPDDEVAMSELRQTLDRLLAIHSEIDDKKADLKTVYADAQSGGFDKSALGAAVREIRSREKSGSPKAVERQAIVDLYIAEYDRPSHVHVREAAGTPSGAEAGSVVRADAPIREYA